MKYAIRILIASAALAFAIFYFQQRTCPVSSDTPALATSGDVWTSDYEAGLARAKAENKPVLLDFTGSDWCPPCIKMHEEVLGTAGFDTWATGKLVPVFLDFPRHKEIDPAIKDRNRKLSDQYAIKGFPTYIVLGPDGKELARQVGYLPGGLEAFKKFVDKAAATVE